MSIEINKAFVQQFSDNLILLSQQKGSRLMPLVMNKKVTGKYAHFDRLGATVAQKKVSRHGDTPLIDSAHSRRRVSMDDYEWADLIDTQDEIRMLIDPKSSYAQTGAFALGRAMDVAIIAAATGNAQSIDASDSSSNVALPSGQIIDNDFNTGDSNLIIEKLVEAKRILMSNNVDVKSEDLYFVVNASAHASLLNETEIRSRDFNAMPALVDGLIDYYMGFKFVHTERLLGAGTADTDPVLCLAFAKSGLGLAVGKDVNVKISERNDKSHATQVYACATFGATRIEDEKVVSVECAQ